MRDKFYLALDVKPDDQLARLELADWLAEAGELKLAAGFRLLADGGYVGGVRNKPDRNGITTVWKQNMTTGAFIRPAYPGEEVGELTSQFWWRSFPSTRVAEETAALAMVAVREGELCDAGDLGALGRFFRDTADPRAAGYLWMAAEERHPIEMIRDSEDRERWSWWMRKRGRVLNRKLPYVLPGDRFDRLTRGRGDVWASYPTKKAALDDAALAYGTRTVTDGQ